jgi:hypothetical protein
VAEWSKALVLGTSPQGRGFESHRCQIFYCLFSVAGYDRLTRKVIFLRSTILITTFLCAPVCYRISEFVIIGKVWHASKILPPSSKNYP